MIWKIKLVSTNSKKDKHKNFTELVLTIRDKIDNEMFVFFYLVVSISHFHGLQGERAESIHQVVEGHVVQIPAHTRKIKCLRSM